MQRTTSCSFLTANSLDLSLFMVATRIRWSPVQHIVKILNFQIPQQKALRVALQASRPSHMDEEVVSMCNFRIEVSTLIRLFYWHVSRVIIVHV